MLELSRDWFTQHTTTGQVLTISATPRTIIHGLGPPGMLLYPPVFRPPSLHAAYAARQESMRQQQSALAEASIRFLQGGATMDEEISCATNLTTPSICHATLFHGHRGLQQAIGYLQGNVGLPSVPKSKDAAPVLVGFILWRSRQTPCQCHSLRERQKPASQADQARWKDPRSPSGERRTRLSQVRFRPPDLLTSPHRLHKQPYPIRM